MADDKNKNAAIRKRQQIDSSNRTMFAFVAGSAFIVGAAIVVAIFLGQQIVFNTKIINEKSKTVKTLKGNIEAVDELKKGLGVLETDEALASVKLGQDNSALQSVLDALPAEPNVDALGASLQERFIGAVDGLSLENLTIAPDNSSKSSLGGDGGYISFSMSVSDPSGGMDKFRELLARFEKSIRVIEVQSIEIQSTDNRASINIKGRARYELAQHVELETKIIKPSNGGAKPKANTNTTSKDKQK